MMEYLCHAVLAVMIVHNELDCVKLNTQILFEELKGTGSEIVIVDNCSDDGLSEWLSGQELASYVICDERIEGYGAILRIVTDQFANGRDILLLRANYFLKHHPYECGTAQPQGGCSGRTSGQLFSWRTELLCRNHL